MNRYTFLIIMLAVYVAVACFSPPLFLRVFSYFISLFLRLLPVFALVILITAIVNEVHRRRRVLIPKGWRGWLIAVMAGILSTGPIYAWYPLLSDMRRKGVSYGKIATFLYNRAVKVPLLPLMVAYFGALYTAVLCGTMVVASLVLGVLIDLLMGGEANARSSGS